MKKATYRVLALAVLAAATSAAAQVTFYEREAFEGRSFTAKKQVGNFERAGFNDRASSAVVVRDRWEVCEDARFSGRCVVLRPGRYASLGAMGINNRISSVRIVSANARVDDNRYAPPPLMVRDYRRRNNERVYDAEVVAVRAVVGPPEQRCWVEREQVGDSRGEANIVGGLAGAVIGGILGHQIGSGRGNQAATAGGAIAGGAIGMNIGRDRSGQPVYSQNVQRCRDVPSRAAPEYWDVTYEFRGQPHTVQMSTLPGRTIRVNAKGEPRA